MTELLMIIQLILLAAIVIVCGVKTNAFVRLTKTKMDVREKLVSQLAKSSGMRDLVIPRLKSEVVKPGEEHLFLEVSEDDLKAFRKWIKGAIEEQTLARRERIESIRKKGLANTPFDEIKDLTYDELKDIPWDTLKDIEQHISGSDPASEREMLALIGDSILQSRQLRTEPS